MEPILETRLAGAAGLSAEPAKSAASWSAIFAGAVVAASVSLVLLALGSGLGFASVSPWQGQGVSVTTFAVTTAIWLIVMQWASSAVGGYMAGRLRTRWIGTNPHEVFFRDTAHGFVTWAVATTLVAVVLASSVSSVLGSGTQAVASVAAGAAQGASSWSTIPSYSYGLDSLFRSAEPGAPAQGADPKIEVTHIVAQSISTNGSVSDADRAYLASLVAAKTGVSADEAQKRVNDFIATANSVKQQVQASADSARKAAAKTAIFTALALAIGAFIASVTAALGGKLRDEHP